MKRAPTTSRPRFPSPPDEATQVRWQSYPALLRSITAAVAVGGNLPDLLNGVLSDLITGLDVACGAVWLAGSHAHLHLSPSVLSKLKDVTPHDRTYLWTDGAERPETSLPDALLQALRADDIRAALILPLTSEGRVIGRLMLGAHEPRSWGQADLAAASLCARQLAIAADQMNLIRQVALPGESELPSNLHPLAMREQRARQLETLNEVARSLTSTLELDPLLNKILESAVDLLGGEAGSLLLVDERSGEMIFQVSVGPVAQNLIGTRLPPGKGLAGKAVDTRRPVLVNDVRQSKEWFQKTDQLTGFSTEAMIVVPMQVKDRVIGVIEVINKYEGGDFTSEDQQMLTALASQAAVALDNARLFEAERRRRQELESLRQASLQVTSSLELQPVLEAILEHALQLVAGDRAHIYLYENDQLTTGALRRSGETQSASPTRMDMEDLVRSIARRGQQIVLPADGQRARNDLPSDILGNGAFVGLPLRKGDQVLGVMSITFDEPQSMDEDQLRVLELLADQAAVALENARLFEALQARLHELSVFSEAGAGLRDAETLKEMGPLLATHAASMVQADTVLVYVMDSDQERMVLVGSSGIEPEVGELEWELKDDPLSETLRTGSLHYLHNLDTAPLTVHKQIPEDLRPAMCIPIRTTRGNVVGAFLVARRRAPAETTSFSPEEQRLLKTLAGIAGNALMRARSHEELESAYIQTVLSLANAVDARDSYTNDHSQRLAILAEATAIELGCSEEEIQAIHWGALLHDIGKIGVPDDVLSKPGPLTREEWRVMKKHPEIGAHIVAPLKRLTSVVPIILAHQEKYDGTGYPHGLRGEEIPLPARILAVVDAYSAITDERVYRSARSPEAALAEIKACTGTQFDPKVVEAFMRVIEEPW